MNPEPVNERLTALEQWVRGHEALCAERYGDLKETMRWLVRGVFGLMMGVTAWLGVQLWSVAQTRIDALERASAVSTPPATEEP